MIPHRGEIVSTWFCSRIRQIDNPSFLVLDLKPKTPEWGRLWAAAAAEAVAVAVVAAVDIHDYVYVCIGNDSGCGGGGGYT
jgi:hypothetical protein